MSKLFTSADFLIPAAEHLEKWAVLACDQYTSEPAYWHAVKDTVGAAPSVLNCILPEAFLAETDASLITEIHRRMQDFLMSGFLQKYENAYILIERTLKNGTVRRGILGCVDLEEYEFADMSFSKIQASEKTVPERIPPRMAIRDGAPLEFSHVIMLCDDEKKQVIEETDAAKLQMLYDFDLMMNGGHIRGWLIEGEEKEKLEERLQAYEKSHASLPYVIGDGNHSLASAKVLYENGGKDRRLRFASVELNNIHDDAYDFEPIHRLLDADLNDLMPYLASHETEGGCPLVCITPEGERTLHLSVPAHGYILKTLQDLLDRYMQEYPAEIDYIHGAENLRQLIGENRIGFILPALTRDDFFRHIYRHGSYCRKAFSIGEADDKRYYLECRKLI